MDEEIGKLLDELKLVAQIIAQENWDEERYDRIQVDKGIYAGISGRILDLIFSEDRS